MNNTILELSKVIFWDTDQKSLCWKENAHYIISKVVQYGNLKDWNIIKNHYTTKRLEAEVINMRFLISQKKNLDVILQNNLSKNIGTFKANKCNRLF